VVPSAQGSPRKRDGRRMGQARGGGARRPRGGMAELHGPTGGTRDAAPQIPRTPRAGGLWEEVGGSEPMDGGWSSRKKYRMPSRQKPDITVRLAVLLAEDRSLPYRAVPALDEESAPIQCWRCRYRMQTRHHLFKVCSETSLTTGGAARRYWTSSPPRIWKGWPRLGETRGASCQNGSAGSGKRRGERRRRSSAPEGRDRFFSRHLLHGVCGRGVGDGSWFPLVFFRPPFAILGDFFSLVRILYSWDSRGQQTGKPGLKRAPPSSRKAVYGCE